ncbi:uncharacterized protein LOC122723369 [Manihot esculenta]|uniref:Uncharacterized protein n=1 Tax=Manihot esculenta TaxID=3983 RepID=A0A2C9WHX8_MANES|nr:uncharacterized protein LOC122723369 [Manihot esculenta]OAY59734.1 hypothetical protein MANES_01G055100v8 [Manihot esculenta]
MNSIFSSFDALCGELLGQAIRFRSSDFASATTHDLIKKPQQSSSLPSTEDSKREQPPSKAPRFAPELDGLNCFETIVNY